MPNNIMVIPDELHQLDQWIVWRLEEDPYSGKAKKMPYDPGFVSDSAAKSSDPSTWSDFDTALRQLRHYSGLGFVFKQGGGLAGIDLDGCLGADGNVSAWAQEIVDRFNTTYAEISPSGKGIKIFTQGKLAGSIKKSFGDHTGVEVYGSGRFFALTGQMYGTVESVTDCQAGLDWLVAKYGVEVKRDYVPRPSTSDWAKPVGFAMEDFIRRHGIEVTRKIAYNGDGWKWQLKRCPFNPAHANTDACLYERADGTKHFRCSHTSCASNRWRHVRDFYEPVVLSKGVKSWN